MKDAAKSVTGWIEQSLLDVSRMAAGNRRFDLASPAERPIHLGAIQPETLNLLRLVFQQVIRIRE